MAKVIVNTVMLFVILVILCVVKSKESRDPLAKVFKTLPEEEKNDFLTYFLALGLRDYFQSQPRHPKYVPSLGTSFIKSLNISEENLEKFEKMNIPKESRKRLLEWTKNEFSLSTKNVITLLRTKKCQGPNCIALPDVGDICCPW